MSDRTGPSDSAGPAAGPGQKRNEELQDPARADYKAGRDFFKQQDYAQAAMCFHNALRGFEEQGDEQGVANASDRLGDVCLAREEFATALDHFQRAYEICLKESDIFSIVALNRKRASVYRKMRQLDLALSVMMDVLDHHTETRNPQGTVETLEMIAEIYLEKGDNLKAADALRTIAGIHRNFKHKRQAEEFEQKARQAEQV